MSTPFENVLKRVRSTHDDVDASRDSIPGGGATRALREVRRGQFMSIEELAAKAGVSTKTIVETELGRSQPKFRTIKRISEALGVSPRDITEFVATISPEDDLVGKIAA